MCIPVVKSRWRVRHWSAPDRIVSTLSEDAYNGNTEEPPNNVNLTSFADEIQPPTMVQTPYFFSNDLEDDLNEIISPVNSCSKSCKAVHSVYNPSPSLIKPTAISEYDKLTTVNVMSNVEKTDNQTRSQETFPNDDANRSYQSFNWKERHFHPSKPMESVRDDETRLTRKRHVSCPIFSKNNDNDSYDVSPVRKIDGGPSSNLLPVQSMVLMLLLQRRQNSQDISTELNTARRNESTARMTTSRQWSTIRAPRHHRELRKLKTLFPHHNKNEPPNKSNFHRHHNLVTCLPSLLYNSLSPSAHDLQVPDVYKVEEDLDRFPPNRSNFTSFSDLNEDPVVVVNEMTDQTRNSKSFDELILNRQTNLEKIEDSRLENIKYIQTSRSISTFGPACMESISSDEEIEKVWNDKGIFESSRKVINEKNGLDVTKGDTGISTKIKNTIVNSNFLRYQIFNLLSNSPWRHPHLQEDPENSSSQIQYNHKRCLNTVSDIEYKESLCNLTTSPSSNLASNVYWNGKSNKDVYKVSKEDTMSISESAKSTDCQTVLSIPKAEKFEFLKSTDFEEENKKNNTTHKNWETITKPRAHEIIKPSNNKSTTLSRSTRNNEMTILKNAQHNMIVQPCSREVNSGKTRRNGRHFLGMSPIFISLMMFLMAIILPCGNAKATKDPGIL